MAKILEGKPQLKFFDLEGILTHLNSFKFSLPQTIEFGDFVSLTPRTPDHIWVEGKEVQSISQAYLVSCFHEQPPSFFHSLLGIEPEYYFGKITLLKIGDREKNTQDNISEELVLRINPCSLQRGFIPRSKITLSFDNSPDLHYPLWRDDSLIFMGLFPLQADLTGRFPSSNFLSDLAKGYL